MAVTGTLVRMCLAVLSRRTLCATDSTFESGVTRGRDEEEEVRVLEPSLSRRRPDAVAVGGAIGPAVMARPEVRGLKGCT